MIATLSGGFGPGGVQSLQIDLFEYFSNKGNPCMLFDIKNGRVYIELVKKNIDFTFIELDRGKSKLDYSKYLNEDDLLIVFSSNFFNNLQLFRKSNCKILFWDDFNSWLERFIYTKYYPFKYSAIKQEKKILSILLENKAIFFIDSVGKSIVEKRLDVETSNKQYLALPTKIDKKPRLANLKNKISIAYVSRSIIWKINPLVKVLKDIDRLGLNDMVVLNIVTENINNFKKSLEELFKEINSIEINYVEDLDRTQLARFFKKINLNIGMGVAALDGAKIGIPTIIIDASYQELPCDYKYRWIYETNELGLGKMIDQNTRNYGGKMEINEVFKDLKNNYPAISNKCYEYVSNNYNIEIIGNKIENYHKMAKLKISFFNDILIVKINRIYRMLGLR